MAIKTAEVITVKEANMTEQEAQVTEAEEVGTPEAEQPVGEISEKEVTPEAETKTQPTPETKTLQEDLAGLVRGCVAESRECKDLGARFDDTAKRLGIPVNQLIDEVFELVKKAS